MLFADKVVRSIPALLKALKAVDKPDGVRWYRGHANRNWKLLPSLARKPFKAASELSYITRFKQDALAFLSRPPQSDWEWLLLMQHHAAPTRLLDWTENPLVGLYFAVIERPKQDGCLWCLDPIGLNSGSYDKPPVTLDIPCFDDDDQLDNYLPKSVTTLPAKLRPVAALAMRNFPRLSAQSGVFTITHKEQTRLEKLDDGKFVGRLIIPASAKSTLVQQIALLGFTRLTLFPDLDSVARRARDVVK